MFIRGEDGAAGVDSELFATPEALAETMRTLRDADGLFHKYGAFIVGDRVILQHILRGSGWMVKSSGSQSTDAFAAEELAFVRDNPYATTLLPWAQAVGIAHGGNDYGPVAGELTIYEVNSNPIFPRFTGGDAGRKARRQIIGAALRDALGTLAHPSAPVSFSVTGTPPLSLALVTSCRTSP